MNDDALPIHPLRRLVSGESPLKNRLHVFLLIVVWFLPPALFYWVMTGYMRSHRDWNDVIGFAKFLPFFAVAAAILSLLVGRGASVLRTLAVHGLCVAGAWAWLQRFH
ncbi:MAG TPA: hypothetical protein VFA20_00260 [Myxococcaceae bacterium]|nr:hypothetical protein [Myxococcaceae bacterium]